ncbi:MAG: hypothetical protein IMF11_17400 [Proteobacteria bacterium]|nr:hypothetical protein [Pseudomonadota bacterium]
MKDKLRAFADLIHSDIAGVVQKRYPGLNAEYVAQVNIRPGRNYTKVDVGTSGKYMVVNDTGEIFGIKTYGVIHKDKRYGTLDTINDYFWGEYAPIKKLETITVDEVGSFEEELGI